MGRASGTYTPGTSQSDVFVLSNRVQIVGGFYGTSGTEDDPNARDPDPETNGTVLSGDLGVNGNSLVIVENIGSTDATNTGLISFTISGASQHAIVTANSSAQFSRLRLVQNTAVGVSGAAMKNGTESDVRIEDTEFVLNLADDAGGAVWNLAGSRPVFSRCTFLDNTAYGYGGAMFNAAGAIPQIDSCQFIDNESLTSGGAIYDNNDNNISETELLVIRDSDFVGNQSIGPAGAIAIFGPRGAPVKIVHCLFDDNTCDDDAGAIWCGENVENAALDVSIISSGFYGNISDTRGGAIWTNCAMSLTNVVLSGNKALADSGGGVYHVGQALSLVNVTAFGNTCALVSGAGLWTDNPQPNPELPPVVTIRNSIFWNNEGDETASELAQIGFTYDGIQSPVPTVTRSCVSELYILDDPDGRNIGDDPAFVDPDGADDAIGTADDNLRLTSASPVIDRSDSAIVGTDEFDADHDSDFAEKTPDRDLNTRVIRAPMSPIGQGCDGNVDMGALEFSPDNGSATDCEPNNKPDAEDIRDVCAQGEEECDAIDENRDGIIDECQDCDDNGIPDPVDIAGNPSLDCNRNCMIDACETGGDCDDDGIPDSCEVLIEGGTDCNGNHVPDSCEATAITDCNENGLLDECEMTQPIENPTSEFYLAFMPLRLEGALDPIQPELHFLASGVITVEVYYPANASEPIAEVALTPNEVEVVTFDDSAALAWVANVPAQNAIRIKPIPSQFPAPKLTCIAFNRNNELSDGALVPPVVDLGNEYYAVGWPVSQVVANDDDRGQFAIVAVEEGETIVTITHNVDLVGHLASTGVFQVELVRGQGYLAQTVENAGPGADITGVHISADSANLRVVDLP